MTPYRNTDLQGAGLSTDGAAPNRNISNYYTGIDWAGMILRMLEKIHWIILAAIVGAGIAGVYEYTMVKPIYQATSKIYLVGSDNMISISDLQLGSTLAADYKEVFKNRQLHEMVRDASGLNYSAGALGGMVSINNPTNTHVLYITVKAPKREDARILADTYADVVREFISATMDIREPNLFENAQTPGGPINVNVRGRVITGFIGGVGIAVVIIMLIFLLDDRIRSADDVAKVCDLPTLGLVPLQDMKANAAKAAPGALYVVDDEARERE